MIVVHATASSPAVRIRGFNPHTDVAAIPQRILSLSRLDAALLRLPLLLIMAPEVRFTSWGIPYIVEFANVTFRRRASRPPPLPPKEGISLYKTLHPNDSDWSFASACSDSLTFRTVGRDESEGRVLYIRYASEDLRAIPGPPLSKHRISRLRRRIARAVLAGGMDVSPRSERCDSNGSVTKRDSMPVNAGSLYRGTYGQVVGALTSAGLTSTLCDECDVPGGECTRCSL